MCDKQEILDLCRICMKENSLNIILENPLYTDKDVTVLDALGVVMGCEVTSDPLPNRLCSVCFVHLQISYNLKLQFAETQRILLERVSQDKFEEKLEIHENEVIIKDDIFVDSNSKVENNQIVISQIFSVIEEISPDFSKQIPRNFNENNGGSVAEVSYSPVQSSSENFGRIIPTVPLEQVAENESGSENEETLESDYAITNIIEQHQCNICDFKTVNISNLKSHIERVHIQGKNVYKCKFCKYHTSFDSEIDEHVRKNHPNSRPILKVTKEMKCDFCKFSTDKQATLKSHNVKIHNSWNVYKCKTCGHFAYSLHHHQIHMAVRHKLQALDVLSFQRIFKVPSKPVQTSKKVPLHQNARKVETLEISSDEEDSTPGNNTNDVVVLSDEETSRKRARVNETPSRNGRRQIYECGVCSTTFPFISDCRETFKRHGELCHPGLIELKCRRCAYRTFSKQRLNNHLRILHTNFWRQIGEKYGFPHKTS